MDLWVASVFSVVFSLGALVEVNCETDFVAKIEQFKEFVQSILNVIIKRKPQSLEKLLTTLFNKKFDELMNSLLIHIAASKPKYLTREQIPKEIVESQTAIYKSIAESDGKTVEITEKIIQKRLEKFFKMNCLLEQYFVKENERTIKDLLEEVSIELENETIHIERFACFIKGEDLDLNCLYLFSLR